jgi:hypothetical protein
MCRVADPKCGTSQEMIRGDDSRREFPPFRAIVSANSSQSGEFERLPRIIGADQRVNIATPEPAHRI